MDDRSTAWSSVFKALPPGWKVTRAARSSMTGLWSVTAVDARRHAPESRREPLTGWGRTEAEAARRLVELLQAETARRPSVRQVGVRSAGSGGRMAGRGVRYPEGANRSRGPGTAMPLQVRCFPRDDSAFADRVERLVAAVDGGENVSDARRLSERLASSLEELRVEYPAARLVVQTPLATMGDSLVVYAYRDGHALPLPKSGPGAMRAATAMEALLGRAVESVLRAEAALRDAARTARRVEEVRARAGARRYSRA